LGPFLDVVMVHRSELLVKNCFSDIENFTMTQVKYLNALSGS